LVAGGSAHARSPALFAVERLAQQLPGLFVALDDEGQVVVWNAQCERLTGWTLAEVRSDAARLFPDAEHRQRIAAEWTERRRLPLYHDWEWRVTCRDGSRRTFSWSSCHVFDTLSPWYGSCSFACSARRVTNSSSC
jgi:PAS domain S-box-containing protein